MLSNQLYAVLLVAALAGPCWAGFQLPLLFPFGADQGDELFQGELDGSREVPVTAPFTFFGFKHSSLYVNANGAVSFGERFTEYIPEPLVNRAERFAALFWADHYVTLDRGQIWFRTTTDSALLSDASDTVRQYFKGCSDDFVAEEALIATWEEVYSYEYIYGDYFPQYVGNQAEAQSGNRRQRRNHDGENCYQIVLLSDRTQTFAMFNYKQIEWYSSSNEIVRVGFNSGDGVNFFEHFFSGSDLVLSLPRKSNVGLSGRWMYKISTDQILGPSPNPRNGCRSAHI